MNVLEAFKSRSMKSMLEDHVLRNGFSRESNAGLKLLPGPSSHMNGSLTLNHRKVESVLSTMNKLGKIPHGKINFLFLQIVIPHGKIKSLNQSENMKKSSHKYLQVVTTDDFDFWFTGLLHSKKIVKCLQQALSQTMICRP